MIAPMESPPLLALDNVAFAYPGRPALFDGLRFALRENEQIGLYGPNGCGKTTLLRILMGLAAPSAGRVLYHGEPVADKRAWQRLRRGVGFVLQHSDDMLFSVTVLEDVAFGPLNLGLTRREARDRAMETLAELGLEDLADRATQRLSGGEKKMASIAAVLSMRPEVLLLDEPTISLDDASMDKIRALLQRQRLARIVVSHDRDFLEQTSTSFARLDKNGILEMVPGR